MADTFDPALIAETLKAFAHPIRLMILQELAEGTKCVTDMEELLPAKQANISQHLAVLRNAKMVDFAQDGGLRCYYLARPKLVRDILRLMARDEPAIKRTTQQIKMEKERAGRTLAHPVE
ncbi:MAG: metalloregulator ArsR/SmtB family transcription factor [Thermoguttaceae bacterium]|jgi:ArsR family transcriptional regulator